MKKTSCLLYSILLQLKMGQKPHIETQSTYAVHNLLQLGNDNSVVQIKELFLDHQTRLSIFHHILVVIKMWNLWLKQRKSDDQKNVEVLYEDGLWYKGWLSSVNFSTGKWIIKFYDDDDTTETSFPDKEVRLCNELKHLVMQNIHALLYTDQAFIMIHTVH